MGNKIRTRILLGTGKGGIHVVVNIPKCNIRNASVSSWEDAWPRLSRGYVTLGAFERKCAHIQFNSQKLNCDYLIDLLH